MANAVIEIGCNTIEKEIFKRIRSNEDIREIYTSVANKASASLLREYKSRMKAYSIKEASRFDTVVMQSLAMQGVAATYKSKPALFKIPVLVLNVEGEWRIASMAIAFEKKVSTVAKNSFGASSTYMCVMYIIDIETSATYDLSWIHTERRVGISKKLLDTLCNIVYDYITNKKGTYKAVKNKGNIEAYRRPMKPLLEIIHRTV